jgi:putative ABC transport system permease protein
VEGLVAATAVGALAGLLPAVIAVRAKVIDAIRF